MYINVGYDPDGRILEMGIDDHLVIRQMHHSIDITRKHMAQMSMKQLKESKFIRPIKKDEDKTSKKKKNKI